MKKFFKNVFINLALSFAWMLGSTQILLLLFPDSAGNKVTTSYMVVLLLFVFFIPFAVSYIDKKDETIKRFKFVGIFSLLFYILFYIFFVLIGEGFTI